MEAEQKNHSLTQRIVGAIVLISLGIIFIPLFLETDRINPGKIAQSPIPEIPGEISTIVFQLNNETGKFEETSTSKSKEFTVQMTTEFAETKASLEVVEELPEEASTEKVTKPQLTEKVSSIESIPSTSNRPIPVSPKTVPPSADEKITHTWMLQLASFKEKPNALKLRDKIRKRGFVAHIDGQHGSNGSIWRVRVGPELRKSKILEIQRILEDEFALKSLIVRRR